MSIDQLPPSQFGQATLTARLEVVTGLHIGAGKDAIEIGGLDLPVIKTPDGEPYVPGSSLKGKLRFLLEWAFGKIEPSGKPWGSEDRELESDDPVLRIFGTSAKKEAWRAGPTRLLMRDAMPFQKWIDERKKEGNQLTEEKTEVAIDRVAGKALETGPRQIERVPPGAQFDFELAFRIYEVDGDGCRRDLECLAWLIQGLDLLEQDALGGSGSRGYGRVRFHDLKLKLPGENDVSLDNVFRSHAFSRSAPPETIMERLGHIPSTLRPAAE